MKRFWAIWVFVYVTATVSGCAHSIEELEDWEVEQAGDAGDAAVDAVIMGGIRCGDLGSGGVYVCTSEGAFELVQAGGTFHKCSMVRSRMNDRICVGWE